MCLIDLAFIAFLLTFFGVKRLRLNIHHFYFLFFCRYYPDWQEMCDTLDMNTHLPKPVKEEKEPEKVEQKEEEKKEEEKEKVMLEGVDLHCCDPIEWHRKRCVNSWVFHILRSFFCVYSSGWRREREREGSRWKENGNGSGWKTQGNQVKSLLERKEIY